MVDSSQAGGEGETDRIAKIVERLTLREKLQLVHGTYPDWGKTESGASGYLPPIERLGIPTLRFENGPLGVKSAGGTAFPAAIALGAAFDVELAEKFGEALGAEAREHGVDVILAPGCNLVRVPSCGRNFEYYGEDPCHSARIAAAVVRAIQSQGVVATPKHYVANNQEYKRVNVSAEVDERTLRELYLPAFEAAVTEGDAGAVMAAYNRVNGTHATAHRKLLTDVLKNEFEFDGPVISDWWAVQNGPAAAIAGLDLEMPGVGAIDWAVMLDNRLRPFRFIENVWPETVPGPEEAAAWLFENKGEPGGDASPQRSLFARTLPGELNRGGLAVDRLNEMVSRVLTLHERVGALDQRRQSVDVNRTAHRELTKRIATSGSVLLKNAADTLPLEQNAAVAVIGPHIDEAKTGGGGSSEVWTTKAISPLEGIRSRSTGRIAAEHGHPPIETSLPADWVLPSLRRFNPDWNSSIEDARSAAVEMDAAVLVVQDNAAEGRDRASLSLPSRQDELISAVADVAERTIVVLQTAGAVEMPWIDNVDAVMEAWYPGQEAGNAIAALLYGDVDPGGCLPVTFATADEYPASSTVTYPGVEGPGGHPETSYSEGMFIGYRHFDEHDIEPLFPFGHGLSYAEFQYSDLKVSSDEDTSFVSVTVENTSKRRGRDIVQLYVHARGTSVPRPFREFAGFEAITLDAGEVQTIDVGFSERAYAFFDEKEDDWVTETGEFVLEIGRSSRDIRGAVTVKK
ncbi:beta-glucosidase [Natronococcus wangiae]|uniref:beta-glucosidase n=1 Tax=Natronococcus wangiae TaxID=3068275 RepID=UPI00273DE0A9|nr:glycoside hydrolase family 3 C-terminal domain-containing protein [Natronococcus sp. AD5]